MTSIHNVLESLEKEHRLRSIPRMPDQPVIDLSSNDYLSLAERCEEFREEFLDRFSDAAFSSSASRLLSMRQHHHNLLEEYLEQLYGSTALLFNSGYHANVGCVGALNLPSTLFVCDRLIHASVVDGIRMAKAEFTRFPHNDMGKLEAILEKESPRHDRLVVVAESIYSMDGDEAPLQELVSLKRRFGNVMLYIDEAHAFGVRGSSGLGLCEEEGLIGDIDLIIGTFGKAAASAGAFAIGSAEMKSLLINCARPFIFSTALPPANVAWSLLMTEKIVGMTNERRHLADLSKSFADNIAAITGAPTGSTSQIIPLLTGNAERALATAQRLREAGYIALPIRRPTVPPGGERIRFSLCAGMEIGMLSPLFTILEDIWK